MYGPFTNESSGTNAAQRTYSPAPLTADTDLLNALAAAHRLHAKQLTILAFLNDHRDPASPGQTIALSYARIHDATQVTIEHIRRNGLHRLLTSGLISVRTQSFSGTIYRLHYDAPTVRTVLVRLQGATAPHPDAIREPRSTSSITALREELTFVEDRLALVRQLALSRQELKRQEFLLTLDDGQLQWLSRESMRAVDGQEGIRFIRDRFPHYEAERLRLLDEWIARQAFGQRIPTLSSSDVQEITT